MRNFLITILCFSLVFSCKEKLYTRRPFYDSKKNHIGDSVFLNGIVQKIVFVDTTYFVDSIIFKWYRRNSLESVQTFKRGHNVFENIQYYVNGNIKKYEFIDEDNPDYNYVRYYADNGKLISVYGRLFFQGYITDSIPTVSVPFFRSVQK